MKTYPKGAAVNFGIYYGQRLVGVAVFGYCTGTAAKVAKIVGGAMGKDRYLEMQRLWVDDCMGHNVESFCLARIMKMIKTNTKVQLVITHAGGCKNDCGIVYQASGWLYFGQTKSKDFYLTAGGEYKSLVAPMRFGRVPKELKGDLAAAGKYLFGPGQLVDAVRHTYVYPIHRGLRRRLAKKALQNPKNSAHYRRGQEWVT